MSIEHLPGGTAEEYRKHISESMKTMTEIHSAASGMSVTSTYQTIISKIKCCLIDWAPVNHLIVFLLEKEWDTHILELKYNVHLLETVSTRVKKAQHVNKIQSRILVSA